MGKGGRGTKGEEGKEGERCGRKGGGRKRDEKTKCRKKEKIEAQNIVMKRSREGEFRRLKGR